MLRTAFTDLLGVDLPIAGAPMAGVAGGRLAAAVSAGGGLGMIGVGNSAAPEAILAEAQKARQAGQRFGIGLMGWALEHNPGQFEAALEAGPALVSVSFGGDLGRWAGRLRDAGVVAATQVGDVDGARAAADQGVDLIVARGAEGGGHGLDAVATLPLLQGVLDAVSLPVLAAGGIGTSRGLAAVLAAGAAGAWLGTALLSCPEAMNDPAARARVRAAKETGTFYGRVFDIAQRIPWPPQFGGRALANDFSERWTGREAELAGYEQAGAELAAARKRADYDIACIYAGQGAGLVTEERPAAELVADLAAGAERLLRSWG
ncbi:MAG TPA: nitronate monooxygenase [Streptosporangiaceae bacterium]|jgi:nitronate monooxygenase|nr:nitronate monooxygenase [Streptosporangiaceae bacterium]